jgi:nicotinamide-nucleotide amidase
LPLKSAFGKRGFRNLQGEGISGNAPVTVARRTTGFLLTTGNWLLTMLHGEIITTGTELITGQLADSNARYAARRLHQAGLTVARLTTVGDRAALIREVLEQALGRSQFIIVTGGLGPTDDDVTLPAAALALDRRLMVHDGLLDRIRRCLGERQIPWEERYARLALIPEGAQLLDPGSMVCGFALRQAGVRLFFLPGVPEEMRNLFDAFVLPVLVEAAGGGEPVVQRTLRFFGISETQLQEVVRTLPEFKPGVSVGYYPNFPENHLTLTVQGPDPAALEATLDRLTGALAREVGEALLGPLEAPLEELVGRLLTARGLSLAVAESCTGGLIGHRLTGVPGSSDYFLGGVVSYSNEAKRDLLRVPATVLERMGAVSPETARDMARGVREVFHSAVGLAVTGIAGPGGGSIAKPVGTVYVGLATDAGEDVWHYQFHGNREEIKTLTAQTALDRLRRMLKEQVAVSG